jgi:hypothetical protein
MDLHTRVRIPFPPEIVFAAIRDEVEGLRPHLEGIHRISVLSREEKDGKVDAVVDWCAGGDVPAPLRALLGEWAFAWTDYSTWDSGALAVDWRTETRALGGALLCGGRDLFLADGEGGTLLEVSAVVEVDGARIPGVPAVLGTRMARRLETYLVARTEASLASTAKALTAYLSERASGGPRA